MGLLPVPTVHHHQHTININFFLLIEISEKQTLQTGTVAPSPGMALQRARSAAL
jgi:hypothetical protein